LMVNIEFMWLDTKQMERLAKARLSTVSKSLQHKFYISPSILQYCIYHAIKFAHKKMLINLIIKKKDNGNSIDTSIVVPVRGVT